MSPKNKSCIVVETPYSINDDISFDNSEKIQSILIKNNFLEKDDILDYKIFDMPYAYPVLNTNADSLIKVVYKFLNKIKNLHFVGRGAEFRYLHTHDLFHRAENITKKLINL